MRPASMTASTAAGQAVPTAAKIIIAGGFGVGKTTFVSAVSEIPAVTTEAPMTTAAAGVDNTAMVPNKVATTVAMDFGRITIDNTLAVYLFATPGQDRFWFMWDQLCRGAIGAVIMVDTRRFADCFAAVDFFERAKLPFAVAVNRFPNAATPAEADIRAALVLPTAVPIVSCDARRREDAKDVLTALVGYALQLRSQPVAPHPR